MRGEAEGASPEIQMPEQTKEVRGNTEPGGWNVVAGGLSGRRRVEIKSEERVSTWSSDNLADKLKELGFYFIMVKD